MTLCDASQQVFIVVSVYFVTAQSGNFRIHPRISEKSTNKFSHDSQPSGLISNTEYPQFEAEVLLDVQPSTLTANKKKKKKKLAPVHINVKL
jgi:hypothetical protein